MMKPWIDQAIAILQKDKQVTLVTAAVLYTSYKLIRAVSTKKLLSKEIPVPDASYFYVGHLFSLGRLPAKKIYEWHKRLGPIIKLYMGNKIWIYIADPVLAHKVLVTRAAETSFRPHSHFSSFVYSRDGHGVAFSQPTANWKITRAKVQSVLLPRQIETYMDAIRLEAKQLVDQLIEVSQQPAEDYATPYEHFKWYTMNTMMTLCFAERFDSAKDPEFEALCDMSNKIFKNLAPESDLANFLPILSVIDYFSNKRKRAQDFIDKERDPLLLKHIRAAFDSEKQNLMKSIKESGDDWTEDDYVVFTSDVVVAGTDTVAVSLLWAITSLCYFPEYQKIISVEIDAFIKANGRLPDFKERMEVPTIICVLKESMRLNPSTQVGVAHAAEEEIEVDGYIFPKGCSILTSMYGIHLGSHYDQPDKFRPERFMKNLQTMYSSQNGKFEDRDQFNFGWGRRICPGTYLAEAELFTAFVEIFARCTVVPPAEGMPDFHDGVNIGVSILPLPCRMSFVERPDALLKVK